jgi:hypothetical protein
MTTASAECPGTMQDDRSFFGALAGDGRPLVLFTGWRLAGAVVLAVGPILTFEPMVKAGHPAR